MQGKPSQLSKACSRHTPRGHLSFPPTPLPELPRSPPQRWVLSNTSTSSPVASAAFLLTPSEERAALCDAALITTYCIAWRNCSSSRSESADTLPQFHVACRPLHIKRPLAASRAAPFFVRPESHHRVSPGPVTIQPNKPHQQGCTHCERLQYCYL